MMTGLANFKFLNLISS